MRKVGLVTLWKRNYGSALQCYATKKTVEKMGYECVLLYRTFPGVARYIYYVQELTCVVINSVRYRGYLKKYISLRNAGNRSISSLSDVSANKLDQFVQTVIQPKGYSYIKLKEIGKSKDYVAFIAGSDQIWNIARRYDPIAFLDFVADKIKIALAPSFGTESQFYNSKTLKKAIKKFDYLSARELDGVEKIKGLTGRKAPLLSDPTVLLSPEEWNGFSSTAKSIEGRYIFVHFLDAPCKEALNAIKELHSKTGIPVVAFAYPHEEYSGIEELTFYDGGVQEYVKYIDEAQYVITDSFHTTLFSIYFNRAFFTFRRQYRHSASQNVRITNLLSLYGLEERLIVDSDTFSYMWNSKLKDCTEIVEQERKKLMQYLNESLSKV